MKSSNDFRTGNRLCKSSLVRPPTLPAANSMYTYFPYTCDTLNVSVDAAIFVSNLFLSRFDFNSIIRDHLS